MRKIYPIITILFLFSFLAVSAQTRKAVGGAEVTGTFRAKGGNEFKILALGKGRLRVAFTGIYAYATANGKMANTGTADGEATIAGDTAVLTLEDFEDCRITMKFPRAGRLEVAQEGGCGFGFNVSADGSYRKISGAKPRF